MNSRQKFTELLAAEQVELGHVALLAVQILAQDSAAAVAATTQGRKQLVELTEAAGAAGCADSANRLVEFLGEQCGFGGNSQDYYATDNSNLGHVLSHKSGIPITLALVYIEVGRALGLDVQGIGFPGHFLVGVYASGLKVGLTHESALIDPFAGALTSREACLSNLAAMRGGIDPAAPGQVTQQQVDQWFQPATPAQITLRLLENLKQIHLQAGASGPALAALELQLLVAPDQFDLRAQHEALLARAFGRGSDPQMH